MFQLILVCIERGSSGFNGQNRVDSQQNGETKKHRSERKLRGLSRRVHKTLSPIACRVSKIQSVKERISENSAESQDKTVPQRLEVLRPDSIDF